MSNMSYVRFQNTFEDLRDCNNELHDLEGNLSKLSKEEARAAGALIQLCNSIAATFSEEQELKPYAPLPTQENT